MAIPNDHESQWEIASKLAPSLPRAAQTLTHHPGSQPRNLHQNDLALLDRTQLAKPGSIDSAWGVQLHIHRRKDELDIRAPGCSRLVDKLWRSECGRQV